VCHDTLESAHLAALFCIQCCYSVIVPLNQLPLLEHCNRSITSNVDRYCVVFSLADRCCYCHIAITALLYIILHGRTDHVGRTVVIDHCGIPGNVWIEGDSDGTCPIREKEASAKQVGFIEVTTLHLL
jgi:hypothetical protein